MATPARASTSVQAPSEPSRGQLAPPSARMVASGLCATGVLSGRSKTRLPPALVQPIQRWRGMKVTPWLRSRCSQARSSGDAFMAAGNTRPLDPTNTGWPSASHQARRCCGGNARIAFRSSGGACG